ncbi:hypothetical protein BJ875DRAFT_266867 [Amylocarpus encephaloides]|uniref:DUF7918 domain-containing protein n=1 Tax=Amylocarpus encephaloides TaxID=45428 RepID=A0A9P7YL45_9HELO|nr:hypothetical protein BJ875DRAFT_266867 [Amylocarpus encephaloides]
MAILAGIPGIEVTIQSEGHTLQEYPDEDGFHHRKLSAPEDCISTSYIQCTSDATFEIRYDVTPEFQYTSLHSTLIFEADVDGKGIGLMYDQRGDWHAIMSNAFVRQSSTQVSKYKLKFGSITKVDDADSSRVKDDVELAYGLGEILVHVHRVNKGSPRVAFVNKPLEAVPEISEKALKGRTVSHGVVYGREERVHKPLGPEILYPLGPNNPLGIFRFKYRSREALQQEMIIPRSPAPDIIPLANAFNPGESRAARLARLKQEIEHIKEESAPESSSARGQKRLAVDDDDVQIVNVRPLKTSRRQPEELVIDLTDD